MILILSLEGECMQKRKIASKKCQCVSFNVCYDSIFTYILLYLDNIMLIFTYIFYIIINFFIYIVRCNTSNYIITNKSIFCLT